jgi:hypothetical protein
MLTKLQFLAVHEHKVLIIAPRQHISQNRGETFSDPIPLLRENPVVATYAPLTDLRRFAGIVGLEDITHLSTEFRDARQSIGYNRTLTVPQALLCADVNSLHMAEMIRSGQANPDLVSIFTEPTKAWDYVAQGIALPDAAAQFLGLKRSWLRMLGF